MDLNNLEEIKKLDPKNVYESTGMLAKQCEEIWDQLGNFIFPENYKDVKNIIICGMGGSAYGGHVALSAFKESLKIPLVVNNNYHLPAFADKDSLVVLVSYSGSTEEILSCASEALEKQCKITTLTSGGKLEEFVKNNNLPSVIFTPTHNPSGQPRLGTGYIVLGTLGILARIGLINLTEADVLESIEYLDKSQETVKKNAQEIAAKLVNHIPVIIAAEFLDGNAHIIRNQFNETSKSFSAFEDIPELNHHLMEGLQNPAGHKLKVLFINSNSYPDIIKKRIELTKDVIGKNKLEYLEYMVEDSHNVAQVFNTLSFGGYVTLYLALLYGLDPSLIPWVDYFKENLNK